MEQRLVGGSKAPEFSSLAAGSGREIGLQSCAGRKLVLIFHLQNTAQTAEKINQAVRERYPSTDEVLVASVIDLSLVPPLYWPTINLVLGNAYNQASTRIPAGFDPADYIVILQDWGGLISRKFGVRGVNRMAAVVIVDEESRVEGFYQGGKPVEYVLEVFGGQEINGGSGG
ncbi:MAG: hypothetical protein WA990_00615 [Rubrobacteraceae bacterium]